MNENNVTFEFPKYTTGKSDIIVTDDNHIFVFKKSDFGGRIVLGVSALLGIIVFVFVFSYGLSSFTPFQSSRILFIVWFIICGFFWVFFIILFRDIIINLLFLLQKSPITMYTKGYEMDFAFKFVRYFSLLDYFFINVIEIVFIGRPANSFIIKFQKRSGMVFDGSGTELFTFNMYNSNSGKLALEIRDMMHQPYYSLHVPKIGFAEGTFHVDINKSIELFETKPFCIALSCFTLISEWIEEEPAD